MRFTALLDGHSFAFQGPPIDISIPLVFNGPQPNTYGVPKAQGAAYEQDGWVGDVRRGGGCNFETYTLTPHCNGTHTECIGHISEERISVHEVLRNSFIPATLLTLQPRSAPQTNDRYDPSLGAEDQVIDRDLLEQAICYDNVVFHQALIIRTLPNTPHKKERDYMAEPPAFLTLEAAHFLRELGVDHLLVDLPSVDRLFDEGKLSVHHIYWDLPVGTSFAQSSPGRHRTITEMIFVPDEVPDGCYLLELQIAPFQADASPSRPRLWGMGR